MPSVVSEHSGPVAILAHSSEPFGDIHRLHEQSNGGPTPPGTQKSLRHGYEDGLIYKGALSIRTIPPPNGEMHDNTNGLSSLPNGRSSAGSRDKDSPRNDSGLGLGVNGSAENNERPFTLQNGKLKVPLDSPAVLTPNKGAVQPLHPIDPGTSVAPNGVDTDAGHQTTLPPSIVSAQEHAGGLLNGNPPLPVTSAQEAPKRNSTTVHRFSSPPAYPSTSQTGSNASNPIPKPQPPPLQHRHTLQVPKPGTTRTSRDGNEGAYTTGRFSPTIAASNARRNSLNLMRRNTRSLHSDAPHEEAPEDEDAMRWAEAIRQKRASKRRRRDEEDEDRVVVGTKVDQHHVNWVTAYNMLTGIRFTVSRTNAKLDRTLTDQDFTQKHKFSFDITGNELTPSAKYDFKFKDYAPWVFRHLRAIFGLDPADYLMSLTSKYILSELGSPGKSGSFFYFSRDYKYIIKTIHQAEHKFLRKILKDYYHHVKENPNTLLSQFYGLHRVKIPYGRKIHFVVMNNLFPPHRDIHQTFDLKGSTIGRDFKEEDLAKNPRATLKDLNWLRRKKHLELGPAKKEVFLDQVEKDVHLLQRLSIMDYSLLVGIHDCGKGNQENLRDKTLKVFQPGGEMSPDESIAPVNSFLSRTPSKLETQRKARELRQMIKQEKPIPMGQTTSKMPDTMDENPTRSPFYNDDGGFQATHEDNRPGEEIYYLGIIDLLTHVSTVLTIRSIAANNISTAL
jgi:1-phosphatidylinositol-4-phosphate 5-kinase